MPHIRLTGLILFITTIFLGLAAAATQTWTIKIKRPSWAQSVSPKPTTEEQARSDSPDSRQYPRELADAGTVANVADADTSSVANQLQFVQVPVFRPLVFFGVLGLILWFVPAGVTAGISPPKKRRRRRRKRR